MLCIYCSPVLFIIVSEEYLGFGLWVGKKKQLEDIALSSWNVRRGKIYEAESDFGNSLSD